MIAPLQNTGPVGQPPEGARRARRMMAGLVLLAGVLVFCLLLFGGVLALLHETLAPEGGRRGLLGEMEQVTRAVVHHVIPGHVHHHR